MKRFLSYTLAMLIAFVITNSINLEASINKFTIYERWDEELERHNYLTVCYNNCVNNSDPAQVNVVKSLIDEEGDALFLFSNPFIVSQYDLQASYLSDNPKEPIFLFQYAISKEKLAKTIETKISYNSSQAVEEFTHLEPKEIAARLTAYVHKAEVEGNRIKEQLEILKQDKRIYKNAALIKGLSIYAKFFDQFIEDIERYKNHINELSLLKDQEDFRSFLSDRYRMTDMNMNYFLFYLKDYLFFPDFSCFNMFKAILDGQSQSKIFLFRDQFHRPELLNAMLIEFGYVPIHTYTCYEVEACSTSINEAFNVMLEGILKNELKEHDILPLMKEISHLYQEMLNVPAQELLFLSADKLSPDLFSNTYVRETAKSVISSSKVISYLDAAALDTDFKDYTGWPFELDEAALKEQEEIMKLIALENSLRISLTDNKYENNVSDNKGEKGKEKQRDQDDAPGREKQRNHNVESLSTLARRVNDSGYSIEKKSNHSNKSEKEKEK